MANASEQVPEGRIPNPGPGLTFQAHAETHVGLVRKVNEDSILDLANIGLWVVADGVGGADAGDRASQLIVDSLRALTGPASAPSFLNDIRATLERVNAQLRVEAAARGSGRLIASTVVCLMFFERWYCCVWAGDSRIYRLHDGQFDQLTRDHSEVQSLLDYGLISPEEARQHPSANVITRAVGADDALVLDAIEGLIEPGDAFLLCSDGLTKVVDDQEIGAVLSSTNAVEAVNRLIQMALDRGAPDNVSVAIVKTDGAHSGIR